MLLEDAKQSRSAVGNASLHFPVFREFKGASCKGVSYAERYRILCHKLVRELLYTSSSVLVSPRSAVDSGDYSELSELTGLRNFVSELAGHVAIEATR